MAFVFCGFVSLLPFIAVLESFERIFAISTALAAATFFALGLGKGMVLSASPLRSGLQALLIGSVAAGLSYAMSVDLRTLSGISPA